MKKYYFLIIVALILGLVLTGCELLSNISQVPATEQGGITYLTKHTADAPYVTDLLAGQTLDVGDVLVWNDGDTLYVKYVITEAGWCLTETHLHVAESLDGIPQKNGNPPPGKFDYKGKHDCLADYTYEIPLDWDTCTELFIAAHAVVCKLSEVMPFTLVSDTGTQCAGYTTTDPSPDPLIPSNYTPGGWSNAVDLSGPHPGTWYNESTPPFSGASWISSADSLEVSGLNNQYRLFRDMFEIPAGAVNRQGKLWMSADNDAIAYLDYATNVVGEIENVYTNSPSGNITPFGEAHYYEFVPGEGLNTLYFVVRNWAWEGANPTGLLYKMDCEYQLLVECETAWAAGFDFPGKNWATFFRYTVQEPIIIDGILSPNEWDCATEIPVAGDMGTVRVLATTDYLYVAFDAVDSNDARIDYEFEVGNDQISINVNPTDGGPWGFPYDLIFETSALSGGCSGSPEDGGHHCLPWNPKVNSGISADNWATRWFPNDAQETLPVDLESATIYSGTNRITEWKLPLSSLPGDVLKVGGAIDVGDGNSYVYPVGLDWSNVLTYVDIVVY